MATRPSRRQVATLRNRDAQDARSTGGERSLFVWVPAILPRRRSERIIDELVTQAIPNADRILFRYKGGARNTNPSTIAAELQDAIATAYENYKRKHGRPYDRVVMMGYSAGALLLRKAIVFGAGHLEDHPFPLYGQQFVSTWHEILGKSRVVLMAGINRGWSLEQRPGTMSMLRYACLKLLLALARILPIGGFALAIERGQPFVANLRVQWIRMCYSNSQTCPPVIQLLGSHDDIVSREDNKDVLVTKKFIFMPVGYSGHATIADLNDRKDGTQRRDKLIEALTCDIDHLAHRYKKQTEELEDEQLESSSERRRANATNHPHKPILAFLMHGIRDNSDWPRELKRVIEAEAEKKGIYARCVPSSYGHFPMAHFLVLNKRRRNVRWFMDRYTEEFARMAHLFGSARDIEIDFVGHSNGTYLLAAGLKTYASMTFDRVAFLGSVVPSNFPWRKYYQEGKIRALRNDRASKDWVVGCFPGFYQLIGNILPIPFFTDLGDGGFRGFDQSVGEDHVENHYFQGGHGAPTLASNHKSLARFILGNSGRVDFKGKRTVNCVCRYLSRLNWLVWICLVALLAVIEYASFLASPALAMIAGLLILLIVLTI